MRDLNTFNNETDLLPIFTAVNQYVSDLTFLHFLFVILQGIINKELHRVGNMKFRSNKQMLVKLYKAKHGKANQANIQRSHKYN